MKGHARNLMTERVISVTADTPLSEVLRMLTTDGLSGVPVVDGDHRVVGFLSETDVLGAFLRGDAEGRIVSDIMSAPVILADEFMTTDDVMELFRDHHIHHLPVVREDRLVGIITPRDVLRYLVQRVLPPPVGPA